MKILVVDDDKILNKGICTFLNSNNIKTECAFNGKEGFNKLKEFNIDLILSDLQMPVVDGLELLQMVRKSYSQIPFVIMTAFSSIESAVEAMKVGAEDYLAKPVNLKELIIKIEKIKNSQKIKNENAELRNKIKNLEMPEIIGESSIINGLKEVIRRVASNSDVPISIYGKSGTGKELVARNIHFTSSRYAKPFLPINCATLSDELMESELFGHVKGSFTGAMQDKIGLIESAEKGTIFLDEISEMSPRVQAKFLRVLQDNVIQPVGSTIQKKIDVRFICASNQKLIDLVAKNKFREDLFYRLNVIEIEVPSLLARKNDIPILIEHLLKKYDGEKLNFSKEAIQKIMEYEWPGNIRELENLIRKLIVTNGNQIISQDDLPKKIRNISFSGTSNEINLQDNYRTAVEHSAILFEKKYLDYHLAKNNYNISKTAESISLSRVSLHKKIKELKISLNKNC